MKGNILVVGSSLKDKGGIVTVIKNIYGVIGERYNFTHIDTFITTNNTLLKFWYFIMGLVNLLAKLLFSSIDLVHIHMSYKGSFYRKSIVLIICKMFRKPVVIHIHGSTFKKYYDSASLLEKKYISFILNKVNNLIVLSKAWRDFFNNIVKDPKKISIVYNGVSVPQEPPIKVPNKDSKFLFLGRLGERKGIYILLDAIKIFKDKGQKGHFYLAGDGEIENVKKVISDYALDDYVTLVGWVDNEEKYKLLAGSDVLVLPSYNEGLPMSLLEAMSFGLSVVSTPVGGIPELVKHRENGLLVEVGNSNNLADALEELNTNLSWRNEMIHENYYRIKKSFNLNLLIKDIENIYDELIEVNGE